MDRAAFTVRFSPDLHEELSLLSELEGASMNKMITQAVQLFVRQRRQANTMSLEATLEKLHRYAESDPGYERAIQEFVKAELTCPDPAEGVIVVPEEFDFY